MNKCRICGNEVNNKQYIIREMMFGTRDKSAYFKCSNCGCIQIKAIPHNVSKYYPDNYYSFQKEKKKAANPLKRFIKESLLRRILSANNFLTTLFLKSVRYIDFFDWIERAELGPQTKILDVGCGSGAVLNRLAG